MSTLFPTLDSGAGGWLSQDAHAQFFVLFFPQLMPVLPLPWAEGGLLNVPQPWTMDFQEIGEKLTIITSLPCSSLAARPACYPRSSQHRPGSGPEVHQVPPPKE